MNPNVIADVKTFITGGAAGGVAGGVAGWLGQLWSARILRKEEARQKLRIDL